MSNPRWDHHHFQIDPRGQTKVWINGQEVLPGQVVRVNVQPVLHFVEPVDPMAGKVGIYMEAPVAPPKKTGALGWWTFMTRRNPIVRTFRR